MNKQIDLISRLQDEAELERLRADEARATLQLRGLKVKARSKTPNVAGNSTDEARGEP